MPLGMMVRVTLGHNGRLLVSSSQAKLAFLLIQVAVLMRVLAPIVNITYVAKLLGINSNTAAVLVTDFCAHNIFVEISDRQRNKLYVFRQYMGIFTR